MLVHPLALAGNVFPGITPAVNIPYLVDILADGIIRIPQDTVLADVHL